MQMRHASWLHLRYVLVLAVGSAASFGQCELPAPRTENVFNYSFEPIFTQDKMALRVTLEFKGNSKGSAMLELPSEWAGQQHAEKSITELKVLSSGTTLSDTKSPAEKELRFPPNTLLRISYVLVKDWDGPLKAGTRFRADLSPNYFHIVGTTSLVHPDIGAFTVADVHFDWQKLPREWTLATSFGTARCQSFHGIWQLAEYALFAGGDYRIYHTTIAGNTLDFAIRGKWNFTDDQWVSQAHRIMEFERTFWQDNDFPYFLVTLTPFGQDHGSQGGTALTSAFMEHLSRLDTLTPETLGILAHETFHGWNPGKMGHPHGSDYPVSWFSEGFTVYYQDLMLFRAGLMPFPEYIDTINEKLRQYELGEGKEASLRDFRRRHSANYSDLDQLDYRRGAVLAAWLDATIRQESNHRSSLDQLMFDLVRQNTAYQRRHHGKPKTLDNQRIFASASKYLRPKSRKRFRHYVEVGGSIGLPETALGPCAQSRVEALTKSADSSALAQGLSISVQQFRLDGGRYSSDHPEDCTRILQ